MPAETRLYITRHGQTDANLEKRVQGQGDTPLNAKGFEQARELVHYFSRHPVHGIVSSDLVRARQTAEVLADALDIFPSYHPQLRARRMGDYENKTHAELEAANPEDFKKLKHDKAFRPPGGGESVDDLKEWLVPLMHKVAELYRGRSVIVLSHHKICQLILAELAGGDWSPIPNARPAVVIYDGNSFKLDPDT
ncbi:MAG: histidine phosphatase family protein [Leptospirillia bacterium]